MGRMVNGIVLRDYRIRTRGLERDLAASGVSPGWL